MAALAVLSLVAAGLQSWRARAHEAERRQLVEDVLAGLRRAVAGNMEACLLDDMGILGSDLEACAAALGPAPVDCLRRLVLAYAPSDRDDASTAQAALERAIAADPPLEEAYQGLAHLHLRLGNPEQAIAVFGRALESDRGNVLFLLHRAQTRLNLAVDNEARSRDPHPLLEEAFEDLDRGLGLIPAGVYLLLTRGLLRTHRAK